MAAVPITLSVDEHILAALDHYIAIHRQGRSRTELIGEILAAWAANPEHLVEPDEGLRPEELNASNDS
uniref:Ribbon-helix-helix protein CopG domain-containing protein n=1 Tax=Bosea sp. NBC_00436 TaxID=2969620 RepID=A0A9E7ZYS8_9HYPH